VQALVQPVHDQDDRARLLIVEAPKGVVEPSFAACRWASDKASSGFSGSSMTIRSPPRRVSRPPTEVATREPCPSSRIRQRPMVRREAGREEPAAPVRWRRPAAIARQLVGEILAPGRRPRPAVAPRVTPGAGYPRTSPGVNPGVMQRICAPGSCQDSRPEGRPRQRTTSGGAAAC
jgi:hypothetical protein